MKKIKIDSIFVLILYIDIIYASWLLAKCYLIEGFSYIYVSGLFVAAAGIFLIWRHVVISKKKRILIGSLAFFILSAYCCFNNSKLMEWIDNIYVNCNDISGQISDSAVTHFLQYKPILIVLVPVIALILMVIISKGFYNITVFGMIIFVLLLWYTGFSGVIKNSLFSLALLNGVTFAMNSYIRTIKIMDKKRVKLDFKLEEFFAYSLILSLIMAGIISIFPITAPGKYSSTIIHRIKDKLTAKEANGNRIGGVEYGLSLSGYSDSSRKLGGAIEIDNTVAFNVKAEEPVYLRGSAMDYYDGATWTKKNEKFTKKEALLPNSGAYTYVLYRDIKEISINPVNLITSTVFVPEYAFNLNVDNNDLYYDKDNTLQAKKNMEESYKILYHPYNRSLGVISNSKDGSEYKDMDNEYAFSIKEVPDIMSKYNNYLQLPENMPKRVYDLVDKITKDCNTRGEKVEKIYEYLKNSYSYSIDVPDVPQNRDFVDYFLFGEKRGYCTYFASACTIMCRMAGVPARYVEGFNMTNKMNDRGLYEVTNRNAHAWTEILIGPETDLWSIVDCVPNAEELMVKEINENRKKITENIDSQNLPSNEKNRNSKIDPADKLKNTAKPVSTPFRIKVLIFICSSMLLYLFSMLLIYIFEVTSIVRSKSSVPLYMYYLKKMKSMGYRRPLNLCDMEYVCTIEDKELKDRLIKIVDAAYAERFGGIIMGDINKKEYYRFIRRYVKKQKGRRR